MNPAPCFLLLLLATTAPGASKPLAVPTKDDPLHMYLRIDPRLQVRLDVVGDNPPLEEVLDKLREATGLKFTVARNLKGHDPLLGGVRAANTPAWSVMILLLERDLEEGRWEKTTTGYRLEATASLRQRAVPMSRLWWLLPVGLAVLAGLGYLLYRRRSHLVEAAA